MKKLLRFLVPAAVLGASVLGTAPANAASVNDTVSVTVAVARSYAACATITRSNSRWISGQMTAVGAEEQGLGVATIDSSSPWSSNYGTVKVCTGGGFTAENGEATFKVQYQTPSGVSGYFVVQCVTADWIMACSNPNLQTPDLDPA